MILSPILSYENWSQCDFYTWSVRITEVPPPFSTCPGGVTAVLLADGARRNRRFSVEGGGTWGQWWIHSECNLLHHYVSPVVSLGSPSRLLPLGPPHGVRYWWYLGEAVKIIFLYLQTLYHEFCCFRNLAMALTHSVIKVWPIMLKSMTLLHVWEVRLHVGLHWLNVCLHWLNVGPQA